VAEETYALSTDAAEFYESTFVPALFDSWAQRLVQAADLAQGQTVLDVACGTGVVARAAAERVGPSGTVVGLDRNEAMLAVAGRLRPDLQWRLGEASALPFGPGTFDAVLSQAALMFFDDRVAALQDMGRVAGTHGRIAVQVPGRLANSPGYSALAGVVARHAPPQVRDLLDAYFAVGEPDVLTGLFDKAGLRIEQFETWSGATRLDSIDTFLAVELLPIADHVDQTVRDRIVDDCRSALAGFVDPSGAIAAPIEVHLVTARRG
jgi:ubiquinone/menaquinone biosynthesis C-methylase UbiE